MIVNMVSPPNAVVGDYFIEVILYDGFNPTPTNKTYLNFTILMNNAPYANAAYVSTFSTTIPWPFNYTLNTTVFTDAEGDAVIIDCATITTTSVQNDYSWTNYIYSAANKNLTFWGLMPRNNNYQGTYTFDCLVHDAYAGTPTPATFILTVNPKA